MRTRRARPADAPAIHRLIAGYAAEGLLLPRSEDEIRAHATRFLVLTETRNVPAVVARSEPELLLGCVALEGYGPDLAEIRSLAVDPEARGRGIGSRLVERTLAVARRRNIARVFVVTREPRFFRRQGFAETPRRALREKIARDCRRCPKSKTCDLVALAISVLPQRIVLPALAASATTGPAPAP